MKALRRVVNSVFTLPAFLAVNLTSSAAAAATPSKTVDLQEYRRLIAISAKAVSEKGKALPLPALGAARSLREVRAVRLPDGVVLPVAAEKDATAVLLRFEKKARPFNQQDSDRLRELNFLMAREQSDFGLTTDPQRAADSILQQPEFQYGPEQPEAGDSWLTKELRTFARWLGRLLDRLFGHKSPKPVEGLEAFAVVIRDILIGIAVIGATTGLIFLARYYLNLSVRRRKDTIGAGPLDPTIDDLQDPLSAAQALAAREEFRGAVRLVYIASLRRLSESGLLTLTRSRTNWEYQRALKTRSSTAAAELLPATRLFDHVWYGLRPATRDEYDSILATYETLTSLSVPEPIQSEAAA